MKTTKKRLLLPGTIFNENDAVNPLLCKPSVRFVHLQKRLAGVLRHIFA